jgi:hypothetical protein
MYVLDFLSQFHMSDFNPSPTPFHSRVKLEFDHDSPLVDATLFKKKSLINVTLFHQLIGSLIYLNRSRPNISFTVSIVYIFMQKPHEIHRK